MVIQWIETRLQQSPSENLHWKVSILETLVLNFSTRRVLENHWQNLEKLSTNRFAAVSLQFRSQTENMARSKV